MAKNKKNIQLAQAMPTGTTAVTAFTSTGDTQLNAIVIANTHTSAHAYSLYHDDDGTTYDDTTALAEAISIGANTTVVWETPFAISGAGTIGVKTDSANNITFTFYGEGTA